MEGTRAAGRRPFMPASRILEGSLPERHPKGPDLFWRPTTTQNGVRAGYQGRSPCLQFGHLHGFITLPDRRYASSGRSGLNHGRVADDVCWRALGERFGFDLLTQQCYEVLAGGSPSVRSPLG